MAWLVALALAQAVSEEPVQHVRLEWQGHLDCPAADRFVAALAFRTSRAKVIDGETPAVISVALDRPGRRFRGRLTLRLPTGVTQREATSPRCESVVEALSLMSALVIDPAHARLGPLPIELPPPPVEAPPAEPLAPPAPVESPSIAQPTSVTGADRTTTPVTVVSTPPETPTTERALLLGATGHLTTAISGLADFGAVATIAYRTGLFIGRLEVGGGSGRVIATATGTGEYPFHLVANASAGAVLGAGPLSVELHAVTQIMFFTVSAPRAIQPIAVTRLSPSLGPSVAAAISVGRWSLGVRALLGFNLRRDTYVIDPEGSVFANPLVFIQPSLGVQVRL